MYSADTRSHNEPEEGIHARLTGICSLVAALLLSHRALGYAPSLRLAIRPPEVSALIPNLLDGF